MLITFNCAGRNVLNFQKLTSLLGSQGKLQANARLAIDKRYAGVVARETTAGLRQWLGGAGGCCCRGNGASSVLYTTATRATGVGHWRFFSAQQETTSTVKKRKMVAKLNEQERAEKLQPLLDGGWTLVKGRDAIYKEFVLKDFNQAFGLMTGVALLAEKMNHHPEWFNCYNKVQVTLSTHDVGGLSTQDIRMATYLETQVKLLQ